MKILLINANNDTNFARLVEGMKYLEDNYIVANSNPMITSEEVQQFDPGVIFHNIPGMIAYPGDTNAISVNINEVEGPLCFSFKNTESKNYIKPFVTIPGKVNFDEEKYSGCVVYNGDPRLFGKNLSILTNEEKYQFKFFSQTPFNLPGYSGYVTKAEMDCIVKNSKVTIVLDGDVQALMDVVINDGNPVVYKDEDTFMGQIDEALKNRQVVDGYSRKEILGKNTNVDRVIQIFEAVGLSKVVKDLKKIKREIR